MTMQKWEYWLIDWLIIESSILPWIDYIQTQTQLGNVLVYMFKQLLHKYISWMLQMMTISLILHQLSFEEFINNVQMFYSDFMKVWDGSFCWVKL